METFSDAVFAVAITLLALDLKAPHVAAKTNQAVLAAMGDNWPQYLGLFISFAALLLVWANHHAIFRYVARSIMPLLLANGLVLLLATGSAYPTSIMAHYQATAAAPAATILYTGYLLLLNLSVQLLWFTANRSQLLKPDVPVAVRRNLARTQLAGVPLYAALTVLAGWTPLWAILLSNVSWLYWARGLARAERPMPTAK